MKILVGTPTYNGQLSTNYTGSLLQLWGRIGSVADWRTTSATLVGWARNVFASWVLEGDYTHLLFIDADIDFPPDLVERMIALDRDVRFLLHFTQAANLTGVVKHGLWPRRDLAAADHLAYASDYGRLDGNEDAVSVSISRVNGPMFAAKRRKSGHVDWIVLVLSATILWTHDCRFCWRNAARP